MWFSGHVGSRASGGMRENRTFLTTHIHKTTHLQSNVLAIYSKVGLFWSKSLGLFSMCFRRIASQSIYMQSSSVCHWCVTRATEAPGQRGIAFQEQSASITQPHAIELFGVPKMDRQTMCVGQVELCTANDSTQAENKQITVLKMSESHHCMGERGKTYICRLGMHLQPVAVLGWWCFAFRQLHWLTGGLQGLRLRIFISPANWEPLSEHAEDWTVHTRGVCSTLKLCPSPVEDTDLLCDFIGRGSVNHCDYFWLE